MNLYPSRGWWMAHHAGDGDYGVWMCGGGRTGPDVQVVDWRGDSHSDASQWTVDEDSVGFSDYYVLRPIPPDKVIGIIMAARMSGGHNGWNRIAAYIWDTLDPGA